MSGSVEYFLPKSSSFPVVLIVGEPVPEVRWFRGDRKEPIAIPKARTLVERSLHTLIVPEVTESEKGTYFCRAINAHGQVDMSATVDVISPSAIDGGKPAMFVSRLTRKSIDVIVGEDVSVSFRVNGVPKPRGESQQKSIAIPCMSMKRFFSFLKKSCMKHISL